MPNLHYRVLLKSIFLLAFNAFLRLGEVVVKSKCLAGTVNEKMYHLNFVTIHLRQLSFCCEISKLTREKTSFKSISKHLQTVTCPVLALHHYLKTFGHISGPLFQFMGGEPVSYAFVSKHLHNTVSLIGLNPALYKGHSLRIGAATQAAQQGLYVNCIQKMGRWNSDAV